MSVVAHSPFTGNKRLFDDDASNDSYDWASSCKRGRFVGSPAAAGRGSPKRQAPSSVTPATFTALCGLFPEMDEQVRVWGQQEEQRSIGWEAATGCIDIFTHLGDWARPLTCNPLSSIGCSCLMAAGARLSHLRYCRLCPMYWQSVGRTSMQLSAA